MNQEELKLILKEGENYFTEFKENLSKLDREIVAFANSSGGSVFLGIDDKNDVKGIKITNKLKSAVNDIARNCDPPIDIKLDSIKYNEKEILIVEVLEGNNKPYQCKEGFFISVGPNTQKLKRDEILDFIVEVNKKTFDSLTNKEFNFEEDFDNEKFSNYLETANISSVLSTNELLKNLGLFKEYGLTNAGILFFAKDPQKFSPQSVYTAIVYRDVEGTDIVKREEIGGSLFEIVDKVMDFVGFYTKAAYKFTGKPQRENIYEYPLDAIREAIINSVMHKYYPELGHNNIIAIFPDRIEIEDYWIKPKRFILGQTKFRRNPIITELFFRIGLGEKIGSGIRRMQKICKEVNAPEPEIDDQENYFYVTFKPSYEYLKFVSAEIPQILPRYYPETVQKIITLIMEKPTITRQELSENIGISVNGVKYHLARLKEKGIIKRVGPDRGGYWEVAKKPTEELKLRYYYQKTTDKKILSLLKRIKKNWQIEYELLDLSRDRKYDPKIEKEIYEREFKPRAKLLKKRTGKSIRKELRGGKRKKRYYVSTPGTIAIVIEGFVEWWTLGVEGIIKLLEEVLDQGITYIEELIK